jgi:hypothetical protein
MKFRLKHLAVLAAFAIATPMTAHTATAAGVTVAQDSAKKDMKHDKMKMRAEHRKLKKDQLKAKAEGEKLGQAVKNKDAKDAKEAAHRMAADKKKIAADKKAMKKTAKDMKQDAHGK